LINGFIQGICGLISVLAYGIIGDKFEKKYPNIKSNMGIIGAVLALPAMAGCCLFKGVNFYLSLALLAFKFIISEGFMAPTITMMQSTVKPQEQGSIVSAYLFFLTVAGCLSTILTG
jgi:MFS family permease